MQGCLSRQATWWLAVVAPRKSHRRCLTTNVGKPVGFPRESAYVAPTESVRLKSKGSRSNEFLNILLRFFSPTSSSIPPIFPTSFQVKSKLSSHLFLCLRAIVDLFTLWLFQAGASLTICLEI